MVEQFHPRRFSAAPVCGQHPFGFACVFLVVALISGCATTGGLIPPDVTLVNVELVDATLFESTFNVEVRITNDNPEPLTLDGAVVKLELDGRKFGRGTSAERVEIPRMGSVVQRLELHLSHVAIATKIRGVIESKAVNYTMKGYVYVLKPSGGTKRVPIEREGTIDLSGGGSRELLEDVIPSDAVEG